MDEHFTAMTGLEMDSNRGFKFVLTEDGNYDIEKTPLHGYDSVYQYTSLSNVRYLLQSLFLISAEPDSKKIPGNNIQIAINFSHCKTWFFSNHILIYLG